MRLPLLLFFLLLISFATKAQERDTVINSSTILPSTAIDTSKKPHSPTKAILLSAAVPGLGQVYNKQYWKPPVIYAGFAGLGYSIYFNANKWRCYRKAYILEVDGDPLTSGRCEGVSSSGNLKVLRDYYKNWLDLSIIGTALWYTLNVIDAAVYGHLFAYDVSDDLTLRWRPETQWVIGPDHFQPSFGINIILGP